jgi:hypothetical protein
MKHQNISEIRKNFADQPEWVEMSIMAAINPGEYVLDALKRIGITYSWGFVKDDWTGEVQPASDALVAAIHEDERCKAPYFEARTIQIYIPEE